MIHRHCALVWKLVFVFAWIILSLGGHVPIITLSQRVQRSHLAREQDPLIYSGLQRHGGGGLHASIEPRSLGCEHDVYSWGALMSTGFIFGLPVAILYNLFLDHFIRSLTASGAS